MVMPARAQVHIVEGLGDQIAVGHGSRRLQQAVRQCTFTVIDMGDHTEIPNSLHGVPIWREKQRPLRIVSMGNPAFSGYDSYLFPPKIASRPGGLSSSPSSLCFSALHKPSWKWVRKALPDPAVGGSGGMPGTPFCSVPAYIQEECLSRSPRNRQRLDHHSGKWPLQ